MITGVSGGPGQPPHPQPPHPCAGRFRRHASTVPAGQDQRRQYERHGDRRHDDEDAGAPHVVVGGGRHDPRGTIFHGGCDASAGHPVPCPSLPRRGPVCVPRGGRDARVDEVSWSGCRSPPSLPTGGCTSCPPRRGSSPALPVVSAVRWPSMCWSRDIGSSPRRRWSLPWPAGLTATPSSVWFFSSTSRRVAGAPTPCVRPRSGPAVSTSSSTTRGSTSSGRWRSSRSPTTARSSRSTSSGP